MEESTHQPPEKRQLRWSVSAKELMALPGKKALEVILDSPTPARLVQSLSEEDLFWLVRDIGPEDAIPILSLASNEQWQYLLDLELWQDDRLQVDSVNRWLGLLLKADPERFLIWGWRDHLELIKLNLFKNIDVKMREQDESPSDFDDSYFTLDDLFYIRINRGKYYQTIRQFLERLQGHDPDKFHGVLLELAGILPAEMEEDIYRLRNVRLAEKGFLPFDEALEIYQHLSPQSLAESEPTTQKLIQGPRPAKPVPALASMLVKEQGLFSMSLTHIQDGHILERLQLELAAVCNQIVSADRLIVHDKEDLAAVVRKACGYLSIGLEKVTGGDQHRTSSMLQSAPLHQIFRAGYSTALELQWKTRKWFKESWFVREPFGLSFWEDEWEGMLEGLLKKRPLFHTGYTASSKGEPYREFETLEDITYCHEALDQIVALDHLLSVLLAQTSVAQPVQAYQPVTYKNLLLTCWARDHLGLSEEFEPLQVEDLKSFFKSLRTKGVKPHRIEEKMKQSFLGWLGEKSSSTVPDILEQLGPTLHGLFVELEREYGAVSVEDLDPGYVRHLLVTP